MLFPSHFELDSGQGQTHSQSEPDPNEAKIKSLLDRSRGFLARGESTPGYAAIVVEGGDAIALGACIVLRCEAMTLDCNALTLMRNALTFNTNA